MPVYRAYGLNIRSDIALPALPEVSAEPDIVIRAGVLLDRPPETFSVHGYYGFRDNALNYIWRGVGCFHIADGREIIAELEPGAEELAVTNLLSGPFLALAMHQRGRLIIHGSGVELNGAAVGFLGDTGMGKSTTAAAFMRSGHSMVTDDLLVIEFDAAGRPNVFPGPAQMKLWPETLYAFGREPGELRRVVGPRDKRFVDVARLSEVVVLPLGHLYVLDWGEQPAVVRLDAQSAFVELLRNSYCAMLIQSMRSEAVHLAQCARLAGAVSVARLVRRRDLGVIGEVVDLVAADLAQP